MPKKRTTNEPVLGTIKVGCVHYRVLRDPVESISRKLEENVYGKWSCADRFIWVDPDLNDDFAAQVLLHEVVHAIFDECCISNDDESVVDRLSRVLMQVLQDNPDLMRVYGYKTAD